MCLNTIKEKCLKKNKSEPTYAEVCTAQTLQNTASLDIIIQNAVLSLNLFMFVATFPARFKMTHQFENYVSMALVSVELVITLYLTYRYVKTPNK